MEDSIITNDCLMQSQVHHCVLNRCITNRYHLIDIKIEKSPLFVAFLIRLISAT